MAMADAVWLDVLPSMRNFARNLRREVGAPSRAAGGEAGRQMGNQMAAESSQTFGRRFGTGIRQEMGRQESGMRSLFRRVGSGAGQAGGEAGRQMGNQMAAESSQQFGRRFSSGMQQEMGRQQSGMRSLFRRAGSGAGQAGGESGREFGERFTRDASGRLRDSRGRFASAGQGAGEGFGGGVETGGRGRLGNLSGKFSALMAKAGPWAAAGALIGGIVLKGVQGAMEQQDATASLKARLGEFGPTGARLGKVAGDLYAQAYGDSIGETSTAVEAVVSSIDGMRNANASAVKDMSAKALSLGKAFEIDVGRSMQVVGQLVKSGLVKDAGQGLDLLTATMQKVPMAVREDIVDALDEYSPFMTQIGIKGQKAFELLAQGAEKGMYGIDKTGDALKEFTLRSTDMSKATTEAYDAIGLNTEKMTNDLLAGGDRGSAAFQKIVSGLQGIKDPGERATHAVALFGTPLEDLSKKDIPKFLKSLDLTQNTLGNTGGAAKKMGNTLHDTASNRLTAFTRGLKQGLVNVVGGPVLGSLEKLGDKLQGVPGFAQKAGDKLRSAFAGAGGGGQMEKVADSAGRLGDKLRSFGGEGLAQFDKLRDKVGGLFSDIGDSIAEFRSKHGDKIDKTFRDISSAAAEFGDMVGSGLDLAKVALSAFGTVLGWQLDRARDLWSVFGGTILNAITSNFGGVINTVRGALRTVQGVFQIFTGIFTGDWGKAWTGIKNVVSGAFQFITAMPRAALGFLASTVWSGLTKIGGFFKSIFGGVKNWLTGSFLPWLVAGPRNALTKLRTEFSGKMAAIKNRVISTFTGLKDGAQVRLTQLRDGAAARVQGMRNAVTSRIQAMRDGVVNRITNLKQRGTALVTGLRNDVSARAQSLRDRVVGAITGLKDRAIQSFRNAASGIRSAWSKIEGYTRKPVRFVIQTVYNEGIRGVWNKIAEKVPLIPELRQMALPRGFQRGGLVDMRGGGVQPGYSATDNRLAMFRDGEGVLVPEAVRALGSNFVHMANAMKSRAGALLTGGKLPGFAFGGIIGDFARKAKGFFAGGFVKALEGAFNPLINSVTSRFGSGNNFAGIPGKVMTELLGKAKSWLRQFAAQLEGGDGKKVVEVARKYLGMSGNPNKWTRRMGMNGLPWCAMFVDGVFDEANSSKALRAVTGGRAAVWSYRALPKVSQGAKKAGDLGLYRGDTGHINIYTGRGNQTIGGNESNSVRLQNGYINSASSIRRPAFRRGGIVDLAAQDARETAPSATHPRTLLHRGVMLPGTSAAAPPVLTDRQWREATAQTRGGDGDGSTVTYNVYPKRATLDGPQLKAITRAEEIRARAGRP